VIAVSPEPYTPQARSPPQRHFAARPRRASWHARLIGAPARTRSAELPWSASTPCETACWWCRIMHAPAVCGYL